MYLLDIGDHIVGEVKLNKRRKLQDPVDVFDHIMTRHETLQVTHEGQFKTVSFVVQILQIVIKVVNVLVSQHQSCHVL